MLPLPALVSETGNPPPNAIPRMGITKWPLTWPRAPPLQVASSFFPATPTVTSTGSAPLDTRCTPAATRHT
eukprot:12139352-Alexandrium_andersonii.AAC.1